MPAPSAIPDDLSADSWQPALPPRPYPGLRPFEPKESAIFFGREPMVDEIIDLLVQRCLVLVHGSSGAGKSSVVLAGVLPRLSRQHRRHGWSWRTARMRPGGGPLWNLAQSLAGLEGGKPSPERIDQLRLSFDRASANLAEIVAHLAGMERQRLCLLIDQFEELFRYARETSGEEARLFVDLITTVLNEDSASPVRIILTMRSEFLGECARLHGLDGVVNTAQYLLPRMETPSLHRAIRRPAELYGGEVTIDLADRLITDVQGNQDELPLIQHGLMRLWDLAGETGGDTHAPRRLDLPLYEKHGPLARLLDRHVENVAFAAAPDDRGGRVVEDLFRALTDINNDAQAIRRPQTLKSLIAVTGAERVQLVSILDAFRSDSASFITPYAPAHLGDETMIDISHEALIRCWNRLASKQDGWLHREFRHGLIWRSLLSQAEIFEQNRKNVLGPATTEDREQWLADRTPAWSERYGGGWSRVKRLISASRKETDWRLRRDRVTNWTLATFAVILLTAFIVASFQQNQIAQLLGRANRALARGIWTDIVFNERSLSSRELNALWLLSSDKAIQDRFVAELVSNPADLFRFGPRFDVVTRALGLNWPSPAQAQQARDAVLQRMRQTTDPAELRGLAQAVQALPGKLTETQAQEALDMVLQQMRITSDPSGVLAQAVQALAGKLPEAQVQQALDAVLQAMQRTTGRVAVRGLTEAVRALAGTLTEAQAQQALDAILTRMRERTVPLGDLAEAVRALAGKLTEAQPQQALDAVLWRMPYTPESLGLLAQTVQMLAGKLTEAQVQQPLDAILAQMRQTSNPALAHMVQMLAGKLTETQAQQALDAILMRMRRTTDLYQLRDLAQTVQMLAGKLTEAQAQGALDAVLQTMRGTTDPDALGALAQAVQALAGKRTDAQVQQARDSVLQRMRRTTDPAELWGVAQAVQTLAGQLTEAQAQEALDMVLQTMRGTTDPDALGALAHTVLMLPGKRTEAQAQEAFDTFLQAMRRVPPNPAALRDLAQAVQALAGKLTEAQAQKAFDTFLQAMGGWTYPDSVALGALAQVVQALPGKLTQAQAQKTLDEVLQAMRAARNPVALGALAQVMQALPGNLSDAQAQQAFDAVLQAMRGTTDPYVLRVLFQAAQVTVQAVAAKLTDAQIDAVLRAMQRPTDANTLLSLVEAARALQATDAQAQQAFDAVLRATRGTTDAGTRALAEAALGLAQAAQALADKLTDTQAQQVLATSHLQSAFGWSATAEESAAWAEVIATLLRSSGEPNYVDTIVELLKYPIAAGQATNVLLEALRVSGAPGANAGLPANLRWLADTYPAIDLGRAPACPMPLSAGLACPSEP